MTPAQFQRALYDHLENNSVVLTPLNVGFSLNMDVGEAARLPAGPGAVHRDVGLLSGQSFGEGQVPQLKTINVRIRQLAFAAAYVLLVSGMTGCGVEEADVTRSSSSRQEVPEGATYRSKAPYSWQTSTWGVCSECCGDGFRTRTVNCVDEATMTFVDPSLCTSPPPPTVEACSNGLCNYEWNVSAWSPCDVPCGDGEQFRIVACFETVCAMTVADSYCLTGPAPPSSQACYAGPCMDAGVDAGTDAGVDTDTETGTETDTDSEVDAGTDSGADTDTDTDTDSDTDTDTDSDSDTDTDTDSDSDTDSESDDAGTEGGGSSGCGCRATGRASYAGSLVRLLLAI